MFNNKCRYRRNLHEELEEEKEPKFVIPKYLKFDRTENRLDMMAHFRTSPVFSLFWLPSSVSREAVPCSRQVESAPGPHWGL